MLACDDRTFSPGDKVPRSGIYAVLHAAPHPRYLSLFIDRDTFPSCRLCGSKVTFRLLHPMTNISQETDFPIDDAGLRKTA
ncbi:MAG: hypothetical protein L0Z53_21695 [Acidobacteriales bacterium]|nr:hypothetical protein [Terriglobales bacterium]